MNSIKVIFHEIYYLEEKTAVLLILVTAILIIAVTCLLVIKELNKDDSDD